MIDDNVAQELLYYYVLRHYDVSLLGSQLERMLIAIKTWKSWLLLASWRRHCDEIDAKKCYNKESLISIGERIS